MSSSTSTTKAAALARPIQRCVDQHRRVRMVDLRRRREGQSPSPRRGSLGVDPHEDDPTASRGPLGDGGRPVGVARDHRAPARELWAVLPVWVEGGRSRTPNREGRFGSCLASRMVSKAATSSADAPPPLNRRIGVTIAGFGGGAARSLHAGATVDAPHRRKRTDRSAPQASGSAPRGRARRGRRGVGAGVGQGLDVSARPAGIRRTVSV